MHPDSSSAENTSLPWRLWLAVFLLIPVADLCLYEIQYPRLGFAIVTACMAALGLFVSRCRGRIIPGMLFMVPTILSTVINVNGINVLAILIGFTLLFWNNRANALSWNLVGIPMALLCSPFTAIRLFLQSLISLSSSTRNPPRHLGRLLRIVIPTIVVSVLFFLFLAAGNAVLFQWTKDIASWFSGLLSPVQMPDPERMAFWVRIAVFGVVFLIPAWLCYRNQIAQRTLKSPFDISQNKPLLRQQFIFVLAGVNLVFLLTNTLDAVYLWIRRAPPAGINTTAYLYEGFYALLFTVMLAGVLLAFMFNHSDEVKNSRWLIRLAVCWTIQNIILVAGVAFRLWLHVDKFCLTPRRLQVGLFLILVLASLILLMLYILRKRSLDWLLSSNVITLFSFVFCVQFLNIGDICVQSAISKLKTNQQLRFDADFFDSVGISGWQLLRFMAEDKEHANLPEYKNASVYWRELTQDIKAKPRPFSWQSFSWHSYGESKALCSSLGIPETDITRQWDSTVSLMHRHATETRP